MPRLNELPLGKSISGIIYGGAKTGKTVFVASAGDRSLFINIGNGIVTLQSAWFKRIYNSNPIIETVTEEYVPTIASGYDKVGNLIEDYLKNKSSEFDTIIIDDATNLRRMAMTKGLELNQALNKSKTKDILTSNKKVDVIVPTVADYGAEMALIDQFIGQYITMCELQGKHFLMTAHERLTFEKGKNIGDMPTLKKVSPGFTGATFPDSVTGIFDLVWHMEAVGSGNQTQYRARTQGDESLTAGTRYPELFPTLYPNPKFTDVINAVKSQKPITGVK
jgi:hypothetical protein